MSQQVPPITICFLIECATCDTPGRNIWPGGWRSPAGLETRKWLKENGLITADHAITERGQAWLDAIMSTPLPETRNAAPRPREAGELIDGLDPELCR